MLERMRFRRRVSASVFADEEEGDFGEGILEEDDVAMGLDISNFRRRKRQERREWREMEEKREGFSWKTEIMLFLF